MKTEKQKPTLAQVNILNEIRGNGIILEVASGFDAYLKRKWESARILDKSTGKTKAASIGAVNVMIRNGWLSLVNEFDDRECKTHYRHYVIPADSINA